MYSFTSPLHGDGGCSVSEPTWYVFPEGVPGKTLAEAVWAQQEEDTAPGFGFCKAAALGQHEGVRGGALLDERGLPLEGAWRV